MICTPLRWNTVNCCAVFPLPDSKRSWRSIDLRKRERRSRRRWNEGERETAAVEAKPRRGGYPIALCPFGARLGLFIQRRNEITYVTSLLGGLLLTAFMPRFPHARVRRKQVEETEKNLTEFRLEQDTIKRREAERHAEDAFLHQKQIRSHQVRDGRQQAKLSGQTPPWSSSRQVGRAAMYQLSVRCRSRSYRRVSTFYWWGAKKGEGAAVHRVLPNSFPVMHWCVSSQEEKEKKKKAQLDRERQEIEECKQQLQAEV